MTERQVKITLALAAPNAPGNVLAWCDIEREHEDGRLDFFVINGHWRGTLYRDGTMSVGGQTETVPCIEVWRGRVPREHMRDYNAAIGWIEEQIAPRCVGAHDRCFLGGPCPYCERPTSAIAP